MGTIAFLILFGAAKCTWTPPAPACHDCLTIRSGTTLMFYEGQPDKPADCTFKAFDSRPMLEKWLANNKLPDDARVISAKTGEVVGVKQEPIEQPKYHVETDMAGDVQFDGVFDGRR